MTREEFEEFMTGEQWTPEQIAQFSKCTPVGSPAVVRNELRRPDGCVEVIFDGLASLDPAMVDRIVHLVIGGFFYGICHVAF